MPFGLGFYPTFIPCAVIGPRRREPLHAGLQTQTRDSPRLAVRRYRLPRYARAFEVCGIAASREFRRVEAGKPRRAGRVELGASRGRPRTAGRKQLPPKWLVSVATATANNCRLRSPKPVAVMMRSFPAAICTEFPRRQKASQQIRRVQIHASEQTHVYRGSLTVLRGRPLWQRRTAYTGCGSRPLRPVADTISSDRRRVAPCAPCVSGDAAPRVATVREPGGVKRRP